MEQQPPIKELEHDPWELYLYAIKAPTTKEKYCQRLRAFLVERKEIAIGTVRNYAKAINLFYEMADLNIVWQKIMRGLPRARRYADDRAPTLQEIRKITEYPDRRIKPIVYVMASSGIRVGAWDYLQWGHITPIERGSKLIAAKVIVYAGS